MGQEFEDKFYNEEEDFQLNIDFQAIFEKLKKGWKTILLWTVIGGVVGCLFAITVPHKYTVVTKVAPELSLRSSSLTSLASMAGVGMSSMLSGSNDALLPSVYPDIISSTPFLVDILESKIDQDSTLISCMEYDMPKFWLGAVLGFPGMVVGKVKDLIDKEEENELPDGGIDPYRLTRKQAGFCKMLQKNIEVEVNKKNFLVTIKVTMSDKEVAAKVSRLIIDNLKAYVTDYRTQKAVQNADYLEKVAAEAHAEYIAAQKEYAWYLDSNQSMILKSNLVRSVDLQNKVQLKFQLYSSLETELQQARAKVAQETPVFSEILPPSVPTKSANSRKKIAMVFAFLAFVAGCVVVMKK